MVQIIIYTIVCQDMNTPVQMSLLKPALLIQSSKYHVPGFKQNISNMLGMNVW